MNYYHQFNEKTRNLCFPYNYTPSYIQHVRQRCFSNQPTVSTTVGPSGCNANRFGPMNIGILGWGSLIWNQGTLAAGLFLQHGPLLPLQFSRISTDGRLTIVKDTDYGIPTQTWVAQSTSADLNTAIANLRAREGTNADYIGYINLKKDPATFRITQIRRGGTSQRADVSIIRGTINIISSTPTEIDLQAGSGIRRELIPVLKEIIAWACQSGYNAVIWTDLPSNFYEKTGANWSMRNAQNHLARLVSPSREKAIEYINNAPANVKERLNAQELLNAFR